jgi:rubrerythrin
VAIANEEQGLHFYTHAVEVTSDDTARAVFSQLAVEEEEHLTSLQQE